MMQVNNLYTDKKVINIIDDASDLVFNLDDNQMLIVNCFFNDVKKMKIDVNQKSNSYFVINYAGFIRSDADLNVNVNVQGNDNKTVVNVRTIAESGHANFYASIKAFENSFNNEMIEDLKDINEDGTVTFMPILKIDTNEVQAEHYATIGNFDEKELFYLESKLISREKAKDILKKSFIYNLFSDEFLNMLNEGKEIDE